MRLHADYRLQLEHFDFPFADTAPAQICNAFFVGDFSITFRPFFFGPNTHIPFRDGCIVPNRDEWQIDDQTMDGVVSSVMLNPHTKKPIGLRIDIKGLAFAPKSLIPNQYWGDLDAFVGRPVRCTIAEIDDELGSIILQVESIGES